MSRPTLAQKQALARYRELQAHADATRTVGQALHEARHWGERSAFLARQQQPKPEPKPAPAPRPSMFRNTLAYAAFCAICIGVAWVLNQPWFLAWRDYR